MHTEKRLKIQTLMHSILVGTIFALVMNYALWDLSSHPLFDQGMVMSISTLAFSFAFVLWSNTRGDRKRFMEGLRHQRFLPDWHVVFSLLRLHAPGLALFFLFSLIYFLIGTFFNSPMIAARDNFLDTDNPDWVQRIAGPEGSGLEMRVPHPFAYLIFRPLGWLTNLVFKEPYQSATFLNAMAGGLAVFFSWQFIKKQSGAPLYASLWATLIGLSTSHLVLGSLVESYIFSATVLIGFFLVLASRRDPIKSLITLGLLSFGITITNIIPMALGYLVSRPRWKNIALFIGTIASLGVILTLIQAILYPASKPFFLLTSSQGEAVFVYPFFHQPLWSLAGRLQLLLRTMFLYSVIAPLPFTITLQEGGRIPNFQFFKLVRLESDYLYSEFNGLGDLLVWGWVGFLIVAALSFAYLLLRKGETKIPIALILCLVFNFSLHFVYGEDPFLYSPHWTFALIFLVAIGLRFFANRRIVQVLLTIFVLLFAFNQWLFIRFMVVTVLSSLG